MPTAPNKQSPGTIAQMIVSIQRTIDSCVSLFAFSLEDNVTGNCVCMLLILLVIQVVGPYAAAVVQL